MFAVRILRLLAMHRQPKWFELTMSDQHSGFAKHPFDQSTEQTTEQALADLYAEDTLPPGF